MNIYVLNLKLKLIYYSNNHCLSESEDIYSHLDWLQKNHANCYELIDPSTRLQSYYKRFCYQIQIFIDLRRQYR